MTGLHLIIYAEVITLDGAIHNLGWRLAMPEGQTL